MTNPDITHCLETDPTSGEDDAGGGIEVEGLIEGQSVENGEGEGNVMHVCL